jgi:hypothetical protein
VAQVTQIEFVKSHPIETVAILEQRGDLPVRVVAGQFVAAVLRHTDHPDAMAEEGAQRG